MSTIQLILVFLVIVLVYSIIGGIAMAIVDNYCCDVVLSTLAAFMWPLCVPIAVGALAKNVVCKYVLKDKY